MKVDIQCRRAFKGTRHSCTDKHAALFQIEGLLFIIQAFAVEGGFTLYVFGPPSPNHFPLPPHSPNQPHPIPPPHPSNEHVSRAVLVSLDTCSKGPAARKVRGLPRSDCGAAGC